MQCLHGLVSLVCRNSWVMVLVSRSFFTPANVQSNSVRRGGKKRETILKMAPGDFMLD